MVIIPAVEFGKPVEAACGTSTGSASLTFLHRHGHGQDLRVGLKPFLKAA